MAHPESPGSAKPEKSKFLSRIASSKLANVIRAGGAAAMIAGASSIAHAQPQNTNIEQTRTFPQFEGGNLKKTIEFIEKHRAPGDWSRVWDKKTRILFVAENHDVIEDRLATADAMRSSGTTHLAMEFLYQDDQPKIDAYLENKESRSTIRGLLKEVALWSGAEVAESYMNLIDAAKENRIAVIGIDIRKRTSTDSDKDVVPRNKAWAPVLERVLSKNPDGRIVVLVGAMHTGYVDQSHYHYPTANQAVEEKGVPSIVVRLAGGQKDLAALDTATTRRASVDLAARRLGIENTSFLIRTTKKEDSDFVYHAPQSRTVDTR